jgi:hypothetical protein
MQKNRYVFPTTFEGYVNTGEPSGQYNNSCFAFRLNQDVLERAESDREQLLKWAKSNVANPSRMATNPPKWDDEGLVKYSYDGDTNRAAPIFVDSVGDPISKEVLATVRKGTKVNIICQQVPYTKPAIGTTIKVLGVQIIELNAGNGAVDSGGLSVKEVANIFGSAEGFKESEPSVRQESSGTSDYDF